MKVGLLTRTIVMAAMLVATTLAAPAFSQPRPLTEREVIARAREHYAMVTAARHEAEAAAGEVQAAEGAFDVLVRARGTAVPIGGYPQARADLMTEVPTTLWGTTFFAGYRWGSDGVAPYDGKLVTNQYGEVRAGAAVPLWRNGPIDRRRAQIERAEESLKGGALSVEQAKLDAARVAANRYWAWVGAGLRRDVVSSLLQRAEARARDVAERVERGDLPAIDRVDAERSLTQRRQLMVAAERSLDQTSIELSLYLVRPDGTAERPDPSLLPRAIPPLPDIPPDPSDVLSRAIARRPDVARLQVQLAQQEIESRWADNQLAPGVDVVGMGSQDLGPGSAKRSPFELEVGLTIDLPIDTDLARGRQRAARAQAARTGVVRALATQQVLAELRDTRAAVEAAVTRERLATEERALADQNLEAERERLRLGESTVFMVDLREQAALEVALRQIDAAIEAFRATVTWRAAAGDLTPATSVSP